MKKLLLFLIVEFFFLKCISQQVTFQKSYGVNSISDYASAAVSSDINIICGRCADSTSNYLAPCFLKFDGVGNLTWSSFYRFVGTHSIIERNNGEYLTSGQGGYFPIGLGFSNCNISNIDTNGFLIWSKDYGDSLNSFSLNGIQKSNSGGYIAGGIRYYSNFTEDLLALNIDSTGVLQWAKSYYGCYQELEKILATSDGGCVITGTLKSDTLLPTSFRAMLMKIDSSGNPLWTKQYSYNNSFSEGFYLQETPDKGIITVGIQFGQVFLLKTDSMGNELWAKTYYGSVAQGGRGLWLDQTTDGGYVIASQTWQQPPGQLPNLYFTLIKTDSLGNMQWATSPGRFLDPQYVKQTYDGGYFIYGGIENADSAGNPQWDLYIIKTDSLGHWWLQ